MSERPEYDTEVTLREHGPTERSWTYTEPMWRKRAKQMAELPMGRPVPAGPWDDEPDKVQWIDPQSDLDCLAVRNHMGVWCGYVGVPDTHPHFGKGYDEVPVHVHGDLTFADSRDEGAPEGFGICHTPFPGRPGNIWWFGFDCGHAWDLIPGMQTLIPFHDQTYRDLSFVKSECVGLARQLKMLLPVTDLEIKEVFGG